MSESRFALAVVAMGLSAYVSFLAAMAWHASESAMAEVHACAVFDGGAP